MAQLKSLTINDTGFVKLPSGTTLQRPASPTAGMMRFNTDFSCNEYYNGTSWIDIATGAPSVVTNGLVLNLDAGVSSSYPGSGTLWRDLSGAERNYEIGSNISWNSSGYFSVSGGVFTGPASNTFGFASTNEHTVEVFCKVNAATSHNFFYWYASPNVGDADRAIFSHLHLNNGFTYYDVSGCCTATQRISYANDSDLIAGVRHLVWRTRKNTTPNRQFFKNLVSQMDSGANNTETVTWNLTKPATIADGWSGNLYSFRVYNRALTDTEIANNYNSLKGRYGL